MEPEEQARLAIVNFAEDFQTLQTDSEKAIIMAAKKIYERWLSDKFYSFKAIRHIEDAIKKNLRP